MSIWQQAADMAQKTPPERNRYVDLLRALSISAVVLGHWLMAAPFLDYTVVAPIQVGWKRGCVDYLIQLYRCCYSG